MNPRLRRSAAHVFVESLHAPVLIGDDEHHLARVLRLRAGEVVSISDGAGVWRTCRFGSGNELEPDSEIEFVVLAAPQLTIGFAIPKGDRPEWIVQKLTEIGVDRIVVLHSDRSVIRWDGDRSVKQMSKLARVAREAAMQSRRVWLPQVDGPISFASFVAAAGDGQHILLAEPDGDELSGDELSGNGFTILVGPEGGWSASELAAVPRHVCLASTILRVETATLVAAVKAVGWRAR